MRTHASQITIFRVGHCQNEYDLHPTKEITGPKVVKANNKMRISENESGKTGARVREGEALKDGWMDG